MTWGLRVVLVGVLAGAVAALASAGAIAQEADLVVEQRVFEYSPAPAFRTINTAMMVAKPGQTVRVGPGIYRETVVCGEGVKLIGAGPRLTIIEGQLQGASGASAEGVTIRGGAAIPGPRAGRYGRDSDWTGIRPGVAAVVIRKVQVFTLRGCWVRGVAGPQRGNGIGILVEDSAGVEVVHNVVNDITETHWGSAAGIWVMNSTGSIHHNVVGNIGESMWGFCAGVFLSTCPEEFEVAHNTVVSVRDRDWDSAYGIRTGTGVVASLRNNFVCHVRGEKWGDDYGIACEGAEVTATNNVVVDVSRPTPWAGAPKPFLGVTGKSNQVGALAVRSLAMGDLRRESGAVLGGKVGAFVGDNAMPGKVFAPWLRKKPQAPGPELLNAITQGSASEAEAAVQQMLLGGVPALKRLAEWRAVSADAAAQARLDAAIIAVRAHSAGPLVWRPAGW